MTDPKERRRHARTAIQANVILEGLRPEDKSDAFPIRGIAVDISAGGLRIKSHQLERTHMLQLLRTIHHVRVRLLHPALEETLALKGQIVWADYHGADGKQRAHCLLGVSFYKFTPEGEADLDSLIQKMRAASGGKE
jgi:hypothetical protein